MSAAARQLPFVIPKRINRSKTAILKALSETVGVDKTAPHFALIDDPTTIPTTAADRRKYFLAREFGRRAARQLAEEWPTLFMFDRDTPRLKAFRPEKLPSLAEAEHVDEATLRRLVDANQVKAALKVFERLRANNTELSPEVLQDLFSMTAYFNARDPPPSENEEWPGVRIYYRDPSSTASEGADLVNLLYSMVDRNVHNYSTMISWLCKYSDESSKKRAIEMFKEAVEKKWILEEDAYVGLVSQATKIDGIIDTLKTVAQLKAKPTIRLFNAVIASLHEFNDPNETQKAIQKCIGEAARLGLEPNLTTYFLILATINKDANDEKSLALGVSYLAEILDRIDSQESIPIQQITDQHFFVEAMGVAAYANNSTMMDRIEELYRSRKNEVKMTSFTTEAAFYARYLMKKLRLTSDVDEIRKLYMGMVPRLVGISDGMFELILDKIKGSQNWPLTKRLVEDFISARLLTNERMLMRFLELLLEVQSGEKMTITDRDDFERLVSKLVDFLMELANFTDERDKHLQRKLKPEIIGICVSLLLRADQKKKAWILLNMLTRLDDFEKQITPEGRPRLERLLETFGYAVEDGNLDNVANCLQLIDRYNENFDFTPLIKDIESNFKLSTAQRQVLLDFVRK